MEGLTEYHACDNYTVTVTSEGAWGHALSVSGGGELDNSATMQTYEISETCRVKFAQTVTTYRFDAPAHGTVTFSAICGDDSIMTVAPKLVITPHGGSMRMLHGCEEATASPTKSPTQAPSQAPTTKTKNEAGRSVISSFFIFISLFNFFFLCFCK